MRFFVDNNLAPSLAKMLHALAEYDHHQVIHLRDRFLLNTPDSTWLQQLSREGDWFVLSGDLRISRNPHERIFWQQSELISFFLAKGWINAPFYEQAWKLARWWPTILKVALKAEAGAGFIIPFAASNKLKPLS